MNVRNTLSKDLIVPRLMGVFSYRMTENFVLSHEELAYSLSFIVFFIIHSIYKVHFDTRDITNNSELKIAFINTVESTLMAMALTICCIELFRKSQHLNSIYYLFLRVDLLFQRLQVKTYKCQSPRRKAIKLLYLWPTFFIAGHDIERFIREGYLNADYTHHYLVSFGHIWCSVKLFGIAMTFSVFTDTLGDHFSILNVIVESDGNASKRSLHVISETYDCLMDVFHQINSVFASTLLIMVLNCFVKCTDNFYKIIKGDDPMYWCIYFAVWMAVVIMQLLMLVQSVNYPLKQANLYEWLMYKRMKNDPSSSVGPSHVLGLNFQTKLTLHLMRRKKTTFDLCGFSTLDNGLLGKISAATLTYSIVLSQLNSSSIPVIGNSVNGSSMINNCLP